MSTHDEHRLAELIKALPPAPEAVGAGCPGAPRRAAGSTTSWHGRRPISHFATR